MRLLKICLAAVCMCAVASTANCQAIISTSAGGNTVYLGVNAEGHLNLSAGNVSTNSSRTGLAFDNANIRAIETSLGRPLGPVDSTSPGCFCEGWGVSTSSLAGRSGFANVDSDGGANNLTLTSFSSTASTATSTVRLTNTPGLSVEQAYTVAVPGALFKNHVKITNTTGGTLNDIKYVRVMDWDVPFNEFNEHVSNQGVAGNLIPAPGGKLEYSSDQGFASANPLAGNPGGIVPGTVNTDFVDFGPADHGGYFRFNFGALATGESVEFDVYYGAAPTEAAMLAAITSQSINLYSLGQSGPSSGSTFPPFPGNPATGVPITYAFGFGGVGTVVIPPSPGDVPEPATFIVWGSLAVAAGGVFARRAYKGQAANA